MSSEPTSDRSAELRRALVATADLAPYVRPRPTRKVVVAAIAAFTLAGALTGGAIASASTVSAQQSAIYAGVRSAAVSQTSVNDGTLLGTPILRSGSGTISIDLGKRPADATGIVLGFECLDSGTFSETTDGQKAPPILCEGDNIGGPLADDEPSGSGTHHNLTIAGPANARLVVWVSWLKQKPIQPSAAQTAELADGTITRAEYLAAFNRYVGCMAAAGYPLDGFSEDGESVAYSPTDAQIDSGADNRCYRSEFNGVDGRWQEQHWFTSDTGIAVRKCLTDLGVKKPARAEDAADAQLKAKGSSILHCLGQD